MNMRRRIAVLCEDDPIHLEHEETFIKQILSRHGDWTVISMNPAAFYRALSEPSADALPENLDLAVMDIFLEGMDFDGIRITGQLNERYPKCQVIYLTGCPQYISQVYETEHMYLVLKNEMEEMLPKAVEKACHILDSHSPIVDFYVDGTRFSLSLKEIVYIEKVKGKAASRVVTFNGQHETNLSLSFFQSRWGNRLIRCHHSFLINLDSVALCSQDGFVMKNQILVPFGRTFKKNAQNSYRNYLETKL